VAQYAKTRRAMESSQQRLLKVMRRKSAQELDDMGLRDKLEGEGVSGGEWQRLVVQGEAKGGDRAGGGAQPALAELLSELSHVIDKATSAEEVGQQIAHVEVSVAEAMARTEEKLDDLAAVKAGRPTKSGKQREFLELLREIVQELCQPLSVINGAMEMLSQERTGELGGLQAQLVGLAHDGGVRMRLLVDRLVEIVGVPEGKQPDAQRIGQIYGTAAAP
jgi:signal transduction histidine kinase